MRFAFVCATSLLVAGCSLLDGKATNLEVTAQISSASFRAGDQVMVTITTRNNGFREQGISLFGCPYAFDVIDAQGKQVGPESFTCSMKASTKVLKPGETYVQSFQWSGYGFAGPADEAVKLPPGAYAIRSQWSDDDVDNHHALFDIVN